MLAASEVKECGLSLTGLDGRGTGEALGDLAVPCCLCWYGMPEGLTRTSQSGLVLPPLLKAVRSTARRSQQAVY
jgi:hypothetical protein